MARRIVFTDKFKKMYKKLPEHVKKKVKKQIKYLIKDPQHKSLNIHKMGGKSDLNIWELYVDINYRLTFEIEEEYYLLRVVGTHDILRKK
ncbi:type II toxin-antitoxin system RelE/ParE family toxin [bacterium]|nr:type II toxin-antitoxin system RelE/ParE family toxin [bacterium]